MARVILWRPGKGPQLSPVDTVAHEDHERDNGGREAYQGRTEKHPQVLQKGEIPSHGERFSMGREDESPEK